jgi:hypothetical protein
VFKQNYQLSNAQRKLGEAREGVGAAIAAAASVGYLGFLVGPPVVGSVSGVLGLRMALALVVVAEWLSSLPRAQ